MPLLASSAETANILAYEIGGQYSEFCQNDE